ncbi:hypothetical protein BC834DRAFT_347611, partial [Gloeopeniophorella convolvens]
GIIRGDRDGGSTPESYPVSLPNPWRAKANGRRVVALPIFLYCDDTSGNMSKRWNSMIHSCSCSRVFLRSKCFYLTTSISSVHPTWHRRSKCASACVKNCARQSWTA